MPALDRSLGLAAASSIVAGTIIGASIFVQPAEISRLVPTIPGTLLVWLAAGLLTFCGALVCAELASAYPEAGGVYSFLREGVSPAVGFLWGWAMFWIAHTGIISASSVILARYIAYFFPLGDSGIKIVAITAIVAVSAVNYFGVKQSGALQTIVTGAKLAAIVLLLLLVLFLGKPGATPAAQAADVSPVNVIVAIGAGLFAYGGWHQVTYTAEETRDPERTIPLALLAGTLAVTACYFALNAAYLYLLPLERVAQSTRVAADAAEAMLGPRAGSAVSALVLASAIGVLNGVILAGPRVYLAMAREGLLFRWIAAVHPRFQTPHMAILLQGAWASVLVLLGTYRALFTRVVYTEWLFFGLMTIGLFRLRRRGNRQRAGYNPRYRAWGYPLLPLFFLVSCVVVVGGHMIAQPLECLEGFLFVLIGLPVYYLWARK